MHTPSVDLAMIGGLGIGAKLRESRMVSFTETGLVFHGEMNMEQWTELLRLFRRIRNIYHTGLADIVKFGVEKFGKDAVDSQLAQMEFDFVDVEKARVIGALPDDVRNAALTTEHYWVVGRSEKLTDDERRRWLKIAVDEKLTAIDLQRSIAAGKIVRANLTLAAQGRGSGIATVEGFRQMFDLWKRKVDEVDPIESWDVDRKRKFLDEVGPVVETALKVKASLEQGVSA